MVCGRRCSFEISRLHGRVDDLGSVVELVEQPFLGDTLGTSWLRVSHHSLPMRETYERRFVGYKVALQTLALEVDKSHSEQTELGSVP
jgi:hypothetical protein